jgi:hypothetical protein
MTLNKTIWILWLQGWDKAPWLQQQIAESWRSQNPTWKIVLLSMENLKDYVTDCPYLYDPSKQISMQAASDIIRLSLLKNQGGVWADSTMLCMQSLDKWLTDEQMCSGLWCYHGGGGGLPEKEGVASWFIISEANGYMITKWKELCDQYWTSRSFAHEYFWMDSLFRVLYDTDPTFKAKWRQVPSPCCEDKGQAHWLAYTMLNSNQEIKDFIRTNPPYAFKLSKNWTNKYKNEVPAEATQTNGYYAIQLSKQLS